MITAHEREFKTAEAVSNTISAMKSSSAAVCAKFQLNCDIMGESSLEANIVN